MINLHVFLVPFIINIGEGGIGAVLVVITPLEDLTKDCLIYLRVVSLETTRVLVWKARTTHVWENNKFISNNFPAKVCTQVLDNERTLGNILF